jgi:hypothetical protein
MFTRQAPPLGNNLWQAGLSPAQAAALQNLLGQCRQELQHNGPVTYDYTQPQMRLIGPSDAVTRYPGGVLPSPEYFPKPPSPVGNPIKDPPPLITKAPTGAKDKNKKGQPGAENRPGGFNPPDHLPDEPQQDDGPGEDGEFPGRPPIVNPQDWFAGKYILIDKANREINLDYNDLRRHAVFPHRFNKFGRVHSVDFDANPGGNKPEYIKLAIEEQVNATKFSVITNNLRQVEFISGINTQFPGRIVFERSTAMVFDPQQIAGGGVDLPDCCGCGCTCSGVSSSQPPVNLTSDCNRVICAVSPCVCPTIDASYASSGEPINWGAGTYCYYRWEGQATACELVNQEYADVVISAECQNDGDPWNVSVAIYGQGGLLFSGSAPGKMCVLDGKITGTVTGIQMTGHANNSATNRRCSVSLTFNPMSGRIA